MTVKLFLSPHVLYSVPISIKGITFFG